MDSYSEKLALSVSRAKEKLAALKSEESLVFSMFADLHTEDLNHEYTKNLVSALELITKEIEYDAVINLGDNFGMLGRNIHITNEELKARFERVFSAIYDATKHPMINANGNHDAIGTDFFKSDFWNSIVKSKYGNTDAIYGEHGSYYYVDYEKAKTRLVVLALPHESDIESEMPTPLWEFGKAQLEWLKGTALNTDKDVIIISHVPFYYKYMGDREATLGVWTGEQAKVSYISALCGDIGDLDEAMAIINEFDSRPDTRLVACLSGHMHFDSFWVPYEEKDGRRNPLPCHQFVTTAACLKESAKTEFGISIDLVVWTPTRGEFNLIRIGDGSDRKINL